MAATKVGIIFDSSTKAVRRIIIPDSDAQLGTPDGNSVVNPSKYHGTGEKMYVMSKTTYDLQTDLATLLATLSPILALL